MIIIAEDFNKFREDCVNHQNVDHHVCFYGVIQYQEGVAYPNCNCNTCPRIKFCDEDEYYEEKLGNIAVPLLDSLSAFMDFVPSIPTPVIQESEKLDQSVQKIIETYHEIESTIERWRHFRSVVLERDKTNG